VSFFDTKWVHSNKKARQFVGGRFVHFKKSLGCRRSPRMPVMVMMVTGSEHEKPVYQLPGYPRVALEGS
jgi:hypothetical protein